MNVQTGEAHKITSVHTFMSPHKYMDSEIRFICAVNGNQYELYYPIIYLQELSWNQITATIDALLQSYLKIPPAAKLEKDVSDDCNTTWPYILIDCDSLTQSIGLSPTISQTYIVSDKTTIVEPNFICSANKGVHRGTSVWTTFCSSTINFHRSSTMLSQEHIQHLCHKLVDNGKQFILDKIGLLLASSSSSEIKQAAPPVKPLIKWCPCAECPRWFGRFMNRMLPKIIFPPHVDLKSHEAFDIALMHHIIMMRVDVFVQKFCFDPPLSPKEVKDITDLFRSDIHVKDVIVDINSSADKRQAFITQGSLLGLSSNYSKGNFGSFAGMMYHHVCRIIYALFKFMHYGHEAHRMYPILFKQ